MHFCQLEFGIIHNVLFQSTASLGKSGMNVHKCTCALHTLHVRHLQNCKKCTFRSMHYAQTLNGYNSAKVSNITFSFPPVDSMHLSERYGIQTAKSA